MTADVVPFPSRLVRSDGLEDRCRLGPAVAARRCALTRLLEDHLTERLDVVAALPAPKAAKRQAVTA